MLGRSVFLLASDPIANATGKPQFLTPNSGKTAKLAPLAYTSTSSDGKLIDSSRYDVAATTMDTYAQLIQSYVNNKPPASSPDYWTPLVADLTHRYVGYPVPAKSFLPGGSAADPSLVVSEVVPCFLTRCSHFAVEYTGDFITQDPNTGKPSAGPDGVPDFQLVNGQRQVRWYGLPRDTNGDGIIDPAVDVVPLRDLLGTQQPFERILPKTSIKSATANYGSMAITDRYVVAWGPDTQSTTPPTPTPTMLRITIVLSDPAGTLGSAQTFEYIVKLPQ